MWRKEPGEVVSMTRIFNTILRYAIKDEVREIRIEMREDVPLPVPPGFTKGVVVSYLFGEEWKVQMNMPAYVQPKLLAHIRGLAAMDATQNSGEAELRDKSDNFHLTLRVAVEIGDSEIVILRLRFEQSERDFEPR